MKKILLLIVLCTIFIAGNLFAQSKEDAVYLFNGSILRGKVIENITGVKTTIEIVGHNIIVIPDSAIKMILMDQKVPAIDRENKASPVEMAANVSFYGGSQNSGGFTCITAYRFPCRLAMGGGIGIEWFDHQQIPFIADVKYYFLKGSWSPYVYALGGYAVPLSQKGDNEWTKCHGGMLGGTGAGMRFNFSRRNALVFNIGYRYQKTRTVTNYNYWYSSSSQESETIRYDEFNRMTFSFGFLFN
jgi:hypothetical protein